MGKTKKSTSRNTAGRKKPVIKKQKKPTKSKLKSLFKFTLKSIFVLTIWGVFILALMVIYYSHDLPDTSSLDRYERSPGIILLDRHGKFVTQHSGKQGFPIEYKDLSKDLIKAVISTEDRRFFDHFGVDILGIARAAFVNISAGHVVEGGSTITQQLAKILFLSTERTFKRKAQELILSFWLEQRFEKQQILAMYLNRAYMGAGQYGIGAAAIFYFNKKTKDLDLYESAMLAGLLKAPSRYSPTASKELANWRMNVVLQNMLDAGYLDEVDLIEVPEIDIKDSKNTRYGEYFSDWVMGQIPFYIGLGEDIINIRTTLDIGLQKEAERITKQVMEHHKIPRKVSEAAVIAMKQNGEILAMVGGQNYNKSQYNRATQALRQPGSAFKLFVYLAALEHGYYPTRIVKDSPIQISGWAPKNYNNKFYGDLMLSEAFSRSINTATVKISEKIGRKNVIKTAKRLGITSDLQNHPSIALGTGEVSLLELTQAYAHVANDGNEVQAHGIRNIQNKKRQLLYEEDRQSDAQIIDKYTTRLMHNMLEKVVTDGTGRAARVLGPVAGKTGTSQNYRDAWFIGYTDNLVIGVWVGNDDNSPMNKVTGGSIPATIFKQMAISAKKF